MHRLRGLLDVLFDVVDETTDLVQRTHGEVLERSKRRFAPVEPARSAAEIVTGVQKTIAKGVCGSIRLVNGATRYTVNALADAAGAGVGDLSEGVSPALAAPARSSAKETSSWYVDCLQGSINGFWGDHLNRRGSRLDPGMTFRDHGWRLPVSKEAFAAAFPDANRRVCIFVHGLAATERLWSRGAHHASDRRDVTFGKRLRDDLGYSPLYLRYNSGLHISENGRTLARLLTEVLEAYPWPIEEIALVGHSMGGLVARSAAHYARENDEPWVKHLRHIACLGSPHLGAPLEKAVHVLTEVLRRVDAAGAQVPAELLRARSEGIKDLRHGYTTDEEWLNEDPDQVLAGGRRDIPRVDGVGYYFVATTISRDRDHPLGYLLGDLLVRLPSATGHAFEPARRIEFSAGKVVPGMNHMDLVSHPDVYEALRGLLSN